MKKQITIEEAIWLAENNMITPVVKMTKKQQVQELDTIDLEIYEALQDYEN